MATRSLTKLIIISQVRPLTYAFLLKSLCPLLSSPFSISSFFLFLGFTCYTLSLCLVSFIVSVLDSRRSRMRSLIIHITAPWSPHTATFPPGPFHEHSCLWESCDDRWEELWSAPIKLAVYWGQTASIHKQQHNSRWLLVRAEGLAYWLHTSDRTRQDQASCIWILSNVRSFFSTGAYTLDAHWLMWRDSSIQHFTGGAAQHYFKHI